MARKTVTAAETVAEICLFGTSATGSGWLSRTLDGRMAGTGDPVSGRSFTEAVWQAQDALRAQGVTRGAVIVFFPGGDFCASFEQAQTAPTFGALASAKVTAPMFTLQIPLTPALPANAGEPTGRAFTIDGVTMQEVF